MVRYVKKNYFLLKRTCFPVSYRTVPQTNVPMDTNTVTQPVLLNNGNDKNDGKKC